MRLRDLKGLRYLARLLAEPGRQFHVLDMVAVARDELRNAGLGAENGSELASSSDAGELLDARAKAAYRRRLGEIEEDIEEASATGDAERVAQADAERDFLIRELSRAIGLGGRDRRAGSASERARASVTRAIRQAMARIRDHDPTLGEHLARAIRTGTYCVYLPDARVPWHGRSDRGDGRRLPIPDSASRSARQPPPAGMGWPANLIGLQRRSSTTVGE